MLYLRVTRESRSIDRFWSNKHSACVRVCVCARVRTYTWRSVRGRTLFRLRIHPRSQKHAARGGFHSFRYALELITGNAQLGSFFN